MFYSFRFMIESIRKGRDSLVFRLQTNILRLPIIMTTVRNWKDYISKHNMEGFVKISLNADKTLVTVSVKQI